MKQTLLLTAFLSLFFARVSLAQTPVPWESLRGPAQCRIWPIVQDSLGKIYVGIYQSASLKTGVYQSTDFGITWSGPALEGMSVRGITPLGDGRVFVCGDWMSGSPSNGVYLSTDNGSSWTQVHRSDNHEIPRSIVIDKLQRSYLVSYGRGILVSTDHGQTWDTSNVGLTQRLSNVLIEDTGGVLFLGTDDFGGVFRSTNHGLTWQPVLPKKSIYGLGLGKDGAIFAAGISDTTVNRSYQGELYRSKDGGQSWVRVYVGNYVDNVVVNSQGKVFLGIGYPSIGCSILRSTDDGQTWTRLKDFQRQLYNEVFAMALGAGDHIFVGGDGLIRSTDDGDTWYSANFGLADARVPCLAMNRGGSLFAGVAAPVSGAWAGIYLSPNKGGTWWIRDEGQAVWTLLSAQNGDMFAGGSNGIQLSTNGGLAWSPPNNLPGMPVYSLVQDSEDRVYTGDQGVHRSTDGGTTWIDMSQGLSKKTFTAALAFDAHQILFAGKRGEGIYRSTNFGEMWTPANNGLTDSSLYSLALDSTGRVYAGTSSGLFLSTDNGDSWTRAPGFPTTTAQALAVTPAGHVYVGTTQYVYFSPNFGNPPWYQLVTGLAHHDVSSILVGNDGYVYAGTWGNGAFRRPAWSSAPGAPALVSPPDATVGVPTIVTLRWSPSEIATGYHLQVGEKALLDSGFVLNDSTLVDSCHALSTLKLNTRYFWRVRIISASGAGLFSPTWWFRTVQMQPSRPELTHPVQNAALNSNVVTFVWRKATPEVTRYWHELSSDSMFFTRTPDSTITDTTCLRTGLPNGSYWWRVRAANTAGWGAYSDARKFSVTATGIEDKERLPTEYSLAQNYPNPFNPTTIIRFGLPSQTYVRLTVYGVLGEEVLGLVHGPLPAGYHEVNVDASRLSSGIYFYRLQAGTFVETKRLLLLR